MFGGRGGRKGLGVSTAEEATQVVDTSNALASINHSASSVRTDTARIISESSSKQSQK